MSKPLIPDFSGELYAYLGHFRREEFMRAGHNNTPDGELSVVPMQIAMDGEAEDMQGNPVSPNNPNNIFNPPSYLKNGVSS